MGNEPVPPRSPASGATSTSTSTSGGDRARPESHLRAAARSLVRVLRNPDIRSLELSWTIGVGVDWAILVVALVVAYAAGGALLVGLVTLTRLLPATLVNIVVDTGAWRRPERGLVAVHLVRATGAATVAAAVLTGLPPLAFVAVAVASAAGALVRPITLTLLPAVAERPEDLVSANTAAALGESVGTFLGPLVAGLAVARSGAAPAAALAAAAGVVAAVVALGVTVSAAARVAPAARVRGMPLITGLRELVRRVPAGVVMASFGVQVVVRGALTTFLAVLAIDVLGMGDPGVGVLGAAIGAGGIVGAVLALAVGTGRRLAGLFGVALIAWGAPLIVIGMAPSPVVAILALAVVGVGNALLDVAGLTLLQRGTAMAARSGVFAVLETLASLGSALGAVVASALVAVLGIEAALVVIGVALPAAAVAGWPWVRRLDHEGVLPERHARLLRAIPLFAPLPLAALERLAEGMHEVRFAPGQALMTQGEDGDTYVMVESGRVLVTIDGRPDHEQGAGDGVGEIALLRSMPRTATVTAIEPVEGFEVGCDTFLGAVTGHEASSRAAGAVVRARLGPDEGAA
ncbi:MAG TPA: cyclic nucleotide-binding domain-containing protein [Candidatus Limnocylindrales bacterium]